MTVAVATKNGTGTKTSTKTYRIIRFFRDNSIFAGEKVVLRNGVSLKDAKEHIIDPETSSATCQNAINRARTRVMGPWFDAYEEES